MDNNKSVSGAFILDAMKSLEITEKDKEVLKEAPFFKQMIADQEDRKTIATNDEYMDWLVSMVEKDLAFRDKTLTSEEKAKYRRVENLYMAIADYCDMNYIEPKSDIFSESHLIDFKGTIYEIGVIYGCGSYTFFIPYEDSCDYDVNRLSSCVNFEDVKSNKLTVRAKVINSRKQALEEYLMDMINIEEIPDNVIKDSVDKVLQRKKEEQ